jgi:glycosyltransferase involved in cell wall biosynthesis
MRVLFLSTQRHFSVSGTAYAYRLEKLRSALETEGIETDFLSLRDCPVKRPALLHPLNLHKVKKKAIKADFVHAGDDAAFTAAFLSKNNGLRIIHDIHGDNISEARLKWSVHPGIRSCHEYTQTVLANFVASRRADSFLVVSEPQKELLLKRKIQEERIGLVRNGVDLGLFQPSQLDPPSKFTVTYAGGFDVWQGIDSLVDAFSLIGSSSVHLKIIGFTTNNETRKNVISERFGSKVSLLERLPQERLVEELQNSHVLVIPRFRHPAIEVALPTKFAEYLAVGKPVIVCDVDETADLVREHKCGLVSDPDPISLSSAIIAASRMNPAQLQSMGSRARQLATKMFSWGIVGAHYSELLSRWG